MVTMGNVTGHFKWFLFWSNFYQQRILFLQDRLNNYLKNQKWIFFIINRKLKIAFVDGCDEND